VYYRGVHHVLITGNSIESWWRGPAILLGEGSDVVLSGNTISRPPSAHVAAIAVDDSAHVAVENNTLAGPWLALTAAIKVNASNSHGVNVSGNTLQSSGVRRRATFGRLSYNSATGSYFVNVTATGYQTSVNQVEILLPDAHAATSTAAIVLALPVEAGGTSTTQYGSAIQLIRTAGWHTRQNVAVVTPSFSTTPWYGDNPLNQSSSPVLQESYVLDVIIPWLRQGKILPAGIALAGPISLVGFSKSGWGAFSLLARNPDRFDRAALWDAPTMLGASFCEWLTGSAATPHPDTTTFRSETHDLWGMLGVFGDCDTWRAYSPVELVSSLPAVEAQRLSGRVWLAGQHYFGDWPVGKAKGGLPPPGAPFNHTIDFHRLLLEHNITHQFSDSLDPGRHEWSWLWLKPALDSLLATPGD
jgi:S-formylglutathione hydrolase FrmB